MFVNKVMQYCDANGLDRPALDWLEDHICKQISSWACTSEENYQARVAKKDRPTTENYTGCKACGKRREQAT